MSEVVDKKQKLLVEYLANNREVFLKLYSILNPRYFDTPLDGVISFLKEYFGKYNNLPNNTVLNTEVNIEIKERDLEASDIDYVIEEVEEFCQQNAMRLAILDSVDDIEDNNYPAIDKRIREAMMVKINRDIGLNIFDNPAIRLHQMQQDIDSRSIGYKCIDNVLDYIKRKELGIISAGTGGGKSVMLANVANNLASDGLNCLIISLELNQELYAKRFDTIITGIPIKEIFDRIEEVDQSLSQKKEQYGSITVKREKPGLTNSEIRVLLMEYCLINGYYPDVLIVDYVDIMGVEDKRVQGKFDLDELKTHGLRDICDEFELYGFTACQLNRDSLGTVDLHYGHVAGGLSKVNACDFMLAMYQTEEDIDNDIVNFKPLKLRNAEKSTGAFQMYKCSKTLRFTENPLQTSNLSSPLTTPNKVSNMGGKQKLKNALKT